MVKSRLTYLLALVIFGMNGVVASHIPLGSGEIVFFRTVLGSVFLAIAVLLSRQTLHLPALRAQWKTVTLSGAVMGLGWVLLFEAYRRCGVGTATLIYYCGPVLVMAASPVLYGEKLTPARLLGIAAVAAGMVLINLTGLSGGTAGILCAAAAAVLYAALIVVNQRITGLGGAELTLTQLLTACVVVAPYALLTRTTGVTLGTEGWLAIALLGCVNTGLACYLYFTSLHALPAQTVALLSYVDPASALLFAALFLSERLTPVSAAGAALILGGAAFGELWGTRKKQPQKAEVTQ
jgi:RarD protein